MRLLLTHTPDARRNYYADPAFGDLGALVELVLHHGDTPLDPAGVVAAAAGCDLILADRNTPLPAAVFTALPQLRAALRCAVDIRNIDLAAASAAGILVTHARPGFVESVCELALGMLVDLARGVSRASADYHAGRQPQVLMGRQLAGSTLGIIGYGAIGRHLAALGQAMAMQVLVADPHVASVAAGQRLLPLPDLMAQADHVVCLAVATAETENLIDAAALACMQPHAVFLNLSRGNLVDEAALAEALRRGAIAGAAMDVGRAPDQMPSPALAALPNVIATPHIGGLTPPAILAQALDTVAQVRALLAGQVPHGAVNAADWRRRPAG
jgi:D-3-phosphoglycerate dehydrogenase